MAGTSKLLSNTAKDTASNDPTNRGEATSATAAGSPSISRAAWLAHEELMAAAPKDTAANNPTDRGQATSATAEVSIPRAAALAVDERIGAAPTTPHSTSPPPLPSDSHPYVALKLDIDRAITNMHATLDRSFPRGSHPQHPHDFDALLTHLELDIIQATLDAVTPAQSSAIQQKFEHARAELEAQLLVFLEELPEIEEGEAADEAQRVQEFEEDFRSYGTDFLGACVAEMRERRRLAMGAEEALRVEGNARVVKIIREEMEGVAEEAAKCKEWIEKWREGRSNLEGGQVDEDETANGSEYWGRAGSGACITIYVILFVVVAAGGICAIVRTG